MINIIFPAYLDGDNHKTRIFEVQEVAFQIDENGPVDIVIDAPHQTLEAIAKGLNPSLCNLWNYPDKALFARLPLFHVEGNIHICTEGSSVHILESW